MANPNLASASSVLVGNALIRLTSTSATQVVSNAASSGKAYLIDSLVVSNCDGANAADITIDLFASATNTGTATKLAHTVTVPADATLIVISKENPISLMEAQSIYATASAADDLHVVASWKELS
jgi:hypothetical protein